MTDDPTLDLIRKAVRSIPTPEPVAIDDETLLIHEGIIDSLTLMRLAVTLEQNLSIQISDRDFLPTNFGSITAIRDYLRRRGI